MPVPRPSGEAHSGWGLTFSLWGCNSLVAEGWAQKGWCFPHLTQALACKFQVGRGWKGSTDLRGQEQHPAKVKRAALSAGPLSS